MLGAIAGLGDVIEHDLGEARQGLEFSVERDTLDAIDAVDVSAPDNAEDEFRAAGAGEGLSDHRETSACVQCACSPMAFASARGLQENSVKGQLREVVRGGLSERANFLFSWANDRPTTR